MNNCKIIDGTSIAKKIKSDLKEEIKKFVALTGIVPRLAVIGAGKDPAATVYAEQISKNCNKSGIECVKFFLEDDLPEKELFHIIDKFNRDNSCHGILVKLPLPGNFSSEKIIEKIDPLKDIDCIHPVNTGKLLIGSPPYFPCTPLGIYELLQEEDIKIRGKHVVIIGRGPSVGKPLLAFLLRRDIGATITVCHSETRDLTNYTSQADILITCMGKPEFVKSFMLKPGVVVVDVGINVIPDSNSKSGTRLVGDVAFSEVSEIASVITPVPGGVGPMTVAMVLKNTFAGAKKESKE